MLYLEFLYHFGYNLKNKNFIEKVNTWILDGIIDVYIIDGVEGLNFFVTI